MFVYNECLEIRCKTAHFCILNFSWKNHFVWEIISSILHSISSQQKKHLEARQAAERLIFNSLLIVSFGDETLRLMLDILHKT